MKHRVKVEYTVEIEHDSQDGAIREAAYPIPSKGTMNIRLECWTPKPKVEHEVKTFAPDPQVERTDIPQPTY